MDDVDALVATTRENHSNATDIFDYIENSLYDQEHKLLLVLPQPDHNFLEARIVISDSKKSVKIQYHNKNADFGKTLMQSVGRFHDFFTNSLLIHKISAGQTIFIAIFDFSTDLMDVIEPLLEVINELASLNYRSN